MDMVFNHFMSNFKLSLIRGENKLWKHKDKDEELCNMYKKVDYFYLPQKVRKESYQTEKIS